MVGSMGEAEVKRVSLPRYKCDLTGVSGLSRGWVSQIAQGTDGFENIEKQKSGGFIHFI